MIWTGEGGDDLPTSLMPVLHGGWGDSSLDAQTWQPPSKNLLIFVSSTFLDNHIERNILSELILPQLQKEAEKFGLFVTLTDMRYGVIEANQRNHKVWDFCKAELERCQRDSAGIFFLSLQSERYGYRPLPRSIPHLFFEERVCQLPEGCEAAQVLSQWYFFDENAMPTQHILRDIKNERDRVHFENDQLFMRNILDGIPFDMKVSSLLIGQSITEWETRLAVERCRTDDRHGKKGILWFERTANNSNDVDPDAAEPVNLSSDLEELFADNYDAEGAERLNDLKLYLRAALQTTGANEASSRSRHLQINCPNIDEYSLFDGSISNILQSPLEGYVRQWMSSVQSKLLDELHDVFQRRTVWRSLSNVDGIEEILHHCMWAKSKAGSFVGREQLVHELLEVLELSDIFQTQFLSCAVVGASGCGKTSLMAKVAQMAFERENNRRSIPEASHSMATAAASPVRHASEASRTTASFAVTTEDVSPRPVIIRFCGTSASSSDALSLILSISLQMSLLFHVPIYDNLTDYMQAVQQFHALMETYPVILFIDSLDQLNDTYQGRSRLSFLVNIKPHPDTRIIVSTLPDEQDAVTGHWIYCYQCETRLREWQVPLLEVRQLGEEESPHNRALRNELQLAIASADSATSIAEEKSSTTERDEHENLQLSTEDTSETLPASKEYEDMIRVILRNDYGRTCTYQQMQYILRQVAEEPVVLYLQLACRVIATWTSTDVGVELAAGVTPLINQIFSSLETEYGVVLTRAALGFLTYAKAGVRDHEMQDLLTLHPGVIASIDSFQSMGRQRLPFHVWARLRSALEGLIVEKQDGCLRWYHRQLQEAAERRFRGPESEEKLRLHVTMARYFGGNLLEEEREATIVASQPLLLPQKTATTSGNNGNASEQTVWHRLVRINRRRCVEASYHLGRSMKALLYPTTISTGASGVQIPGDTSGNSADMLTLSPIDRMVSAICTPDVVCACSKTGCLVDYLQDLRLIRSALVFFTRRARQHQQQHNRRGSHGGGSRRGSSRSSSIAHANIPKTMFLKDTRTRVEQYVRWIRMNIAAIIAHPSAQIPFTLSDLAEEYAVLHADYCALMQQLHKPAQHDSSSHCSRAARTVSPSASAWVFPVVWVPEEDSPLVEESVGRTVAPSTTNLAAKKKPRLRPELTLSGCKDHIMAITASPVVPHVAVSYHTGILEIWDIEIGNCVMVLEGTSALYAAWLSYSEQGKHLVCLSLGWFKLSVVEVWDVRLGLRVLYRHSMELSGGLSCSVTMVEQRLVPVLLLGCKDGRITVWDMRSGQTLHHLSGIHPQGAAITCLVAQKSALDNPQHTFSPSSTPMASTSNTSMVAALTATQDRPFFLNTISERSFAGSSVYSNSSTTGTAATATTSGINGTTSGTGRLTEEIFVSGAEDGSIALWTLHPNLAPLRMLRHASSDPVLTCSRWSSTLSIASLCFSHQGQRVTAYMQTSVTGSASARKASPAENPHRDLHEICAGLEAERYLGVWEVSTGKRLHLLPLHTPVDEHAPTQDASVTSKDADVHISVSPNAVCYALDDSVMICLEDDRIVCREETAREKKKDASSRRNDSSSDSDSSSSSDDEDDADDVEQDIMKPAPRLGEKHALESTIKDISFDSPVRDVVNIRRGLMVHTDAADEQKTVDHRPLPTPSPKTLARATLMSSTEDSEIFPIPALTITPRRKAAHASETIYTGDDVNMLFRGMSSKSVYSQGSKYQYEVTVSVRDRTAFLGHLCRVISPLDSGAGAQHRFCYYVTTTADVDGTLKVWSQDLHRKRNASNHTGTMYNNPPNSINRRERTASSESDRASPAGKFLQLTAAATPSAPSMTLQRKRSLASMDRSINAAGDLSRGLSRIHSAHNMLDFMQQQQQLQQPQQQQFQVRGLSRMSSAHNVLDLMQQQQQYRGPSRMHSAHNLFDLMQQQQHTSASPFSRFGNQHNRSSINIFNSSWRNLLTMPSLDRESTAEEVSSVVAAIADESAEGPVSCLCLHPQGDMLAVGKGDTVSLWTFSSYPSTKSSSEQSQSINSSNRNNSHNSHNSHIVNMPDPVDHSQSNIHPVDHHHDNHISTSSARENEPPISRSIPLDNHHDGPSAYRHRRRCLAVLPTAYTLGCKAVLYVRFLRGGQDLLVGREGEFTVWSVSSLIEYHQQLQQYKQQQQQLHQHQQPPAQIGSSPQAPMLTQPIPVPPLQRMVYAGLCQPRFITVSPHDRFLVPNFYSLWDVASGRCLHRPHGHFEYRCHFFATDGNTVLLVCSKEKGNLLNFDPQQLLIFDVSVVAASAHTADLGKQRWSVEQETSYRCYDIQAHFGVSDFIHGAFRPTAITSAHDPGCPSASAPQQQVVALLTNHKEILLAEVYPHDIITTRRIVLSDFANEVYFDPTGHWLLTTFPKAEKTVGVYDLAMDVWAWEIHLPSNVVEKILVLTSRYLLLITVFDVLIIYDLRDQEEICSVPIAQGTLKVLSVALATLSVCYVTDSGQVAQLIGLDQLLVLTESEREVMRMRNEILLFQRK